MAEYGLSDRQIDAMAFNRAVTLIEVERLANPETPDEYELTPEQKAASKAALAELMKEKV